MRNISPMKLPFSRQTASREVYFENRRLIDAGALNDPARAAPGRVTTVTRSQSRPTTSGASDEFLSSSLVY